MKIILLKDVKKIGLKNQVKEVANGYAQFLIGQKKAEMATPDKIRSAEQNVLKVQEQIIHTEDTIRAGLTRIKSTVTLSVKANEKGHLFEAVHDELIAKELGDKMGVAIDVQAIQHAEPIKDIGEYSVSLTVGDDTLQLAVIIVSQ